MSADKNNLLLLFDRPTEPIFMEKGNIPSVFDVPETFITESYRDVAKEMETRFSKTAINRIPVNDMKMPDLKLAMSLERNENFSLFIPKHSKIAGSLIDIFMAAQTIDNLQSIAAYSRDRVNPYVFHYALSVALLHRPDTKNLELPSFAEHFPDKFLDSQIFRKLREQVMLVPEESRKPIIVPIDYTASDLEPEHCLWYFREDMAVNLHHWHWHMVYPSVAKDMKIVAKDRRGELFYYMHQQVIARYNLERFCNKLSCVVGLSNFREPIAEGYFPKLDSVVASRAWPPRFDNTSLSDVNHVSKGINLSVDDLELWHGRIYEAIRQGYAVNEHGERINLDDDKGIDILGNMVEPSLLSPNPSLYGRLHNTGHLLISFVHDPDNRHLESFAVMNDLTTGMRDPVFYRWHKYIDEIFREHKERLTSYTVEQLQYEGIEVTGVKVTSDGFPENMLTTFWQQSDLDLAGGMDFLAKGSIFVRFTHLQHTPFNYAINVNNTNNNTGAKRFGMVRIFLGAKYDANDQRMLLKEQRLFMVELDKFVATINPGKNTIYRKSTESSCTIPFERTFPNLPKTAAAPGGSTEKVNLNFCGCGWPQHMLIPKGTSEGFKCELFVMISNYDDDGVEQALDGQCSKASSYCGVRDRLYPDRRSMGFPFDRLPRHGVDRLVDFLTPNMRMIDVIIQHDPNKIVQREN